MAIKFKEIKKYISRTTRISICREEGFYDNYSLLSDISTEKYDELYVYGVGMIDAEFPMDMYGVTKETAYSYHRELLSCIEIVLHVEDRNIPRVLEGELTFEDLRGYLQIGRGFAIADLDEGTVEYFEMRNEIPDKYNGKFVYGIGIEDDPIRTEEMVRKGFLDTYMGMNMKIVLAEKPRK